MWVTLLLAAWLAYSATAFEKNTWEAAKGERY